MKVDVISCLGILYDFTKDCFKSTNLSGNFTQFGLKYSTRD